MRGSHPGLRPGLEPFLHFHDGPDRTYADVRLGGDFKPVIAPTPKQREVLLEHVKAHVTAELASRQRKRGKGDSGLHGPVPVGEARVDLSAWWSSVPPAWSRTWLRGDCRVAGGSA